MEEIKPQQNFQEFSENDIDREPEKRDNKKIIIVVLVVLFIGIAGLIFWFSRNKLFPPKIVTPKIVEQKINEKLIHDKDADGILDEEEEKLGTSDFEFDTDGDGLSDKSEIDIWQTDPLQVDTDNDGFADGFEILKGYNPRGEGRL